MNKIKVAMFDVDGVLTDGIYTMSSHGLVSKSFYTRDFYGIEKLLKSGIKVLIVTQSHDDVITAQINRICEHSEFWDKCFNEDMLLELHTGIQDKWKFFSKKFISPFVGTKEIAYMGDAENDLVCLQAVACSGCPTDAILPVIQISNFVSDFKGGKGAVYDFCMHILEQNKNLEKGE